MEEALYGFDYIRYYLFILYYDFIGYPLVIRICITVTTILLVFYFFLAIYIALGVLKRKRDKKVTQQIFDRYFNTIIEIVTRKEKMKREEVADAININYKGKKKESNKRLRKIAVLLSDIKLVRANEINKYNFQNVQVAFGISRFLERELLFGSRPNKMVALKLVNSLDVYVSEAVLVRFLYHRSLELRNSARHSYMWLSQSDPFRFFEEDTKMRLRTWDMIEIHDVLVHRQLNEQMLPNFMQWINVTMQEDAKIFFSSEIKFFKLKEYEEDLIKLLNTKSWQFRNELISTLGVLGSLNAEPRLIKIYDMQSEIVRHSILKTISMIHTGNAIPFLKHAYETAETQSTRLLALKGLYYYNYEGVKVFEALKSKANTEFEALLFAHVQDPIINKS